MTFAALDGPPSSTSAACSPAPPPPGGVPTSVGAPAGPINDMAEAFTFSEKLGLNATVAVPGSRTPQVANPVSLPVTPPQYRCAPPRLRQDTLP